MTTSTPNSMAGQIIELNKKEKVWLSTHFSSHNVTANISQTTFKARLKHNDFGEKMMSTELARLIDTASTKKEFCLDIEDSTFGFYPIFTLIYTEVGKKYEVIIKWRSHLMPEKTHKELKERIYTEENISKRSLLKLEKLYPLSHYEY